MSLGGGQKKLAHLNKYKIRVAVGENIAALLQQFKQDKRRENKREATITTYGVDVSYFIDWAAQGGVYSVSDVSEKLILEYIDWCLNKDCEHPMLGTQNRKLSPITINKRLRSMSAFFSWCYEKQHVSLHPMAGISKLTEDEKPIKILEPNEVHAILDQFDNSFCGLRNYAMICTLYGTGMRVGEMIQILDTDVQVIGGDYYLILRHTKNRQIRSIPLTDDELLKVLRRWLNRKRQREFYAEGEPLFPTYRGAALTDSGVRQVIVKACKRAGIKGIKMGPHTFRHTFGTEMVRAKVPDQYIMKIMGHKTRKMIGVYTHLDNADLAEAMRDHSPVSRNLRGR